MARDSLRQQYALTPDARSGGNRSALLSVEFRRARRRNRCAEPDEFCLDRAVLF